MLKVKITEEIELNITGNTEDICNYIENHSLESIKRLCRDKHIPISSYETYEIERSVYGDKDTSLDINRR